MAVVNTFRAVYVHRYASMRSGRASVAMEKAHGINALWSNAGVERIGAPPVARIPGNI